MFRLRLVCGVAIVLSLVVGGCPSGPGIDTQRDADMESPTADDDAAPSAATSGDSAAADDAPAIPVFDDENSVLPQSADDSAGSGEREDSTSDEGDTDGADGAQFARGAVEGAIDAIAVQLFAADAALGALTALADDRLTLEPFDTYEYGVCPVTRFATDLLWALIGVDYGTPPAPGCSGAATAGMTFRGNLGLVMARGTRDTDLEWCDFSIDSHAVTGRVDALLPDRQDGITLVGTCRVTTEGIGEARGSATIDYYEDGHFVYAMAVLALNDGAPLYDVLLSFLAVDALTYTSFVPYDGTLSFEMPSGVPNSPTVPVLVRFTTQTPLDGTVIVTVGDDASYEYQIPGVGS